MDETLVGKYVNWSRCDRQTACNMVASKVKLAEESQSWRHDMAYRGARVYETLDRGPLFRSGQFAALSQRGRRDGTDYRSWKYGRAIIQTTIAKVMGLDNPKCQQVTTDASWEEKRDAVWADRFIEGNAHEPQGNFKNLWDLGRHGATMACASTGMAGIRTEPDFVFKRVSHSLCSTLSTFIDHADTYNGRPLSYFDVTYENPEVLAQDPRWAEHKDHIMASAESPPDWLVFQGELDLGTPVVRVITAWRVQFGDFKGREARFVGGKAIQWDDFPHNQPRVAFFRAAPCLGDEFYSENLLEPIIAPLSTANKVTRRTEQALDLLSDRIIGVDTRQVSEKALVNAKSIKYVKFDSEGGSGAPLIDLSSPIVDRSRSDFAQENIRVAHEISGVDTMHVAGKRPEGIQSGVGVRRVAALFSERHSLLQREWRNWIAVDVAQNNMTAAQEIGEKEPNWQTTWPGQDFDAKVSVDAIKRVSERKYSIRAYVVAEQKNTPADRAELANEMLGNGQISPEAHAQIVSQTFDTPSEFKGQSTQRRFFSKLVDQALYGSQEEIQSEDYWGTKYQSPPPWVDAPSALKQVFEAYLEAMIDDVPQYRREVLKRTLEELDMMIQQAAQSAAAAEGLRVNVDAASVDSAMGGNPPPGGNTNDPTGTGGIPPG